MNCASVFDHAAGFLDGSLSRPDRDAVVRHLAGCADCRALIASLEVADDPGLADAILARTSGAACESARSRLCDRIDGELPPLDAELVDGHLLHCSECGALARALRRLHEDLPRLAALDPGPGFVERVLARTSRRPRRVPLSERWAAALPRLLDRPRIALEGAFVAAIVVGLPFAASAASMAASPTIPLADARVAMRDIESTIHVGARSAWARARAFVVESIHAGKGTFAQFGASGEKGGGSGTNDRIPEAAQEKRR